MGFGHFFVDRPIFASVVSILIVLIGATAYLGLPVAQYPEIAPPTIQVTASYPGASAEVVSDTVSTPLEQEINGVEGMLYMVSQATADGQLSLSVTFALGHRSRHRPGAGPEPGRDRRAAPARRGPPDRRHGAQELARHADGDPPQLARRLARPAVHLELREPADPGRAGPDRRRRRRARVRRAQLFDAHLARSRQGGGARA